MKISEFFSKVESREPHLRRGQAAFNLLWDLRPDLATTIQSTETDPFYNDANLGRFIQFLIDNGALE